MPGFDLMEVFGFGYNSVLPPYQCEGCHGLLEKPDLPKYCNLFKCPVCDFWYSTESHFNGNDAEDSDVFKLFHHLDRRCNNPLVRVDDIFNHIWKLARVADRLQKRDAEYPPLRVLLEALSLARGFIHFVSVGVSPWMIAALKIAAQRIPVRGIVAGTYGESVLSELQEFHNEAPALAICLWEYGKERTFRTVDDPHQKIIVIDGLLAFKGSANLTDTSWRSAATNKELIEVVTNVDEVFDLNNRCFSPLWGKIMYEEGTNFTLAW